MLVIALGLVALAPAVARAQSDEGFAELFSQPAGPFDVAMGWRPPAPQVGYVNIAVRPTLSATGSPVTDARTLLVAESEPGHPEFEVVAVNTPEDPVTYRGNLKFEEAGNWVVHVSVSSPTAGEGDFRTPLVVLPAPIEPGPDGGWAFLGIVIALSAGGAYVVMAIRKSQASQRARLEGRQ